MMDVLQDMQKIKLRIVERYLFCNLRNWNISEIWHILKTCSCFYRSPGGTPIREKPANKAHISDPAALIADALKRKFEHTYLNDSSDKENESSEFSPLSSPETSKVS